MTIRVAINGFGRIGRCILRVLQERKIAGIQVVAINDMMRIGVAAHLLKFDSVHGNFQGRVDVDECDLIINGVAIPFINEGNPAQLPWSRLNVDVVIESTGFFTSRAKAGLHLQAGAKRVLISGPSNDADYTAVAGINEQGIKDEHRIISNASCTTNCLAIVADVLTRNLGFEAGQMSTIHAYTADQSLVDMPHDDLRRARAAAISIIPTATGAARAIGQVLPELDGKMVGLALRVPVRALHQASRR